MTTITPAQAREMLKTLEKSEKEFTKEFDKIFERTMKLHDSTCDCQKEVTDPSI